LTGRRKDIWGRGKRAKLHMSQKGGNKSVPRPYREILIAVGIPAIVGDEGETRSSRRDC